MPAPQATAVVPSRRPLRPLRDAVGEERRRIAISASGAVGHQTCEALVPVVIGASVDRAIAPGDTGALALWIGLLLLLFVALTLAYRTQLTAGERAIEHTQHRMRMRLTRRALDPVGLDPAGAPDDVAGSTGAVVSVAGTDARTAALGIEGVVVALGAVAAIGVSAIVLLTISLPLGLLVLLGAPPVVLLLQRVAVPLEARSEEQQARAADASAVATDLLTGVRVLKGLGAEAAAERRYRDASQSARRASLAAAVPDNVLAGLNVVIGGAFLTVVAYVGGRLALDGTISIGDLIAAVGLTQFLLGPLQRIGWALGLLAQARGSARRVAALLEIPPAVRGGTTPLPEHRPGALRIEGVGLRPDDAPATTGLWIDAAPGDHVGVVVPDAAEAARLLDVLARRRAPDGGSVRVEDVPLDGLAVADARRLMLVSDHDADLFDGTVAENLTGDAAPPSPDVLAASGVDEVLAVLPAGLDAPVGERGSRLSGGQRQRVALARALAADPPVLVLHDPTTAVDAVTEQRIAAGISGVRRGRTTVLVTTSPSLLAACDRVVLVVGGRIVADDVHDRLAADHGTYREAVLR